MNTDKTKAVRRTMQEVQDDLNARIGQPQGEFHRATGYTITIPQKRRVSGVKASGN